MKAWVAGAVLAASLGAGAVGAQPPPNLPGRGSTYPFIANQIGMPGEVILKCLATPEGRVDLCSVVKETPIGFGFGAAALRNASTVKVEPAKAGDPSVRSVLVPQRYRHPLPGHLPPVTSAAALELARRLPSLLAPVDQSLPGYDATIDRVISDESADVPTTSRIAAAAALREALRARLAELHESAAVIVASVFTEEELRSVIAFQTTSAGQRHVGAGTDLAILRLRFRDQMGDRISRASGRFYCASRDCRLEIGDQSLTSVSWARAPDAQAISTAQPMLARTLGLPSRARLDCAVSQDGHLGDCRVATEAPAGLGVGAAAMRLAGGYTTDSASTKRLAGKRAVIVIDFPGLLDPLPMTDAPLPRSARTLALAKEIQAKATTPELHDRWIREAMSFTPKAWVAGLNDADQQAYLAASEHGLVEVHGQIDEHLTQAMANLLSEDDLILVSAFSDTLGGRAMRDRARAMEDGYRWLSPQLFLIVAAEARARYCKAMPCDLPAWALP